MGFTFHWSFKNAPRGEASQTETNYQLAIRQCQRVLRTYNSELKSENPKHPNRLSGYSVHTKVDSYGGLNFNGTQDESCEEFSMREHFSENESDFCKTNRRAYSQCVAACLIILKHYLGDLIEVSSDGRDSKDWTQGLDLASRVTKIKGLSIPIQNKMRGAS